MDVRQKVREEERSEETQMSLVSLRSSPQPVNIHLITTLTCSDEQAPLEGVETLSL